MQISARSVVMSSMATLTATAIALTPVQALPRDAAVPATAAVTQQVPSQQVVDLLAAVQRLATQPGAGAAAAALAADQLAPPTAGLFAFPGLGNAIISAYNIIEPWVAYGVDLADYALGWIPYGWLIGDQINIFYDSLEPAVQSIFYNLGWWIGGSISFGQGLNNVILDSANAFIGLLNAEIRYGFGFLPPLPFGPPQIPYLPWFGLLQAQAPAASADALAPEVGVQNVASDLVNAVYTPISNTITYGVDVFQSVVAPIPLVNIAGDQASILWNVLADPIADSVVYDLIDPVLNQPLNINSYLNGAYDVGATTVNSLINTGFAEVNYLLGSLPFVAGTQSSQLNGTAAVSSVPPIVKKSLAPLDPPQTQVDQAPSKPLGDVAKTVRNVRNEIRTAFTDRRDNEPKQGGDAADAGNNVVRTQGARGPVGRAVADAADALRGGKPNKDTDGSTTAKSVAKSLGDTARKVVKDVRQAAKDARKAAKDGPAGSAAE